MNIGIFSCDPGGATGLAWGIFDPFAQGGMAEVIATRMNDGSATVTGDERTQIREVSELWLAFYRQCVRSACLPPGQVRFVCENFIIKPGQTGGGKDMSISTSIIWGVEGYRMGRADEWKEHRRGKLVMPPMVLQLANQASTYATNQRLKDWNLWVKGREHERSAWRHVALYLARYKQQHG